MKSIAKMNVGFPKTQSSNLDDLSWLVKCTKVYISERERIIQEQINKSIQKQKHIAKIED